MAVQISFYLPPIFCVRAIFELGLGPPSFIRELTLCTKYKNTLLIFSNHFQIQSNNSLFRYLCSTVRFKAFFEYVGEVEGGDTSSHSSTHIILYIF